MMEKMWEALEKLAQSTGVAVEQLYTILVQQAKVQLVFDVLLIIGIIILIAVGVFLTKYFLKKSKENELFDIWELPAIIVGFATCIGGFAGCTLQIPTLIADIIQILINPSVWILEYVMNLIK